MLIGQAMWVTSHVTFMKVEKLLAGLELMYLASIEKGDRYTYLVEQAQFMRLMKFSQ